MCTAATYQTKDFYMGRTLDYETILYNIDMDQKILNIMP